MLDLLFIGDCHYSVKNILQTDIFEKELYKHLHNNKYDYIVLAGDNLCDHERLHVEPLNRINNFFRELMKYAEVITLVGNHDFENNNVFLTNNHWLNMYKHWGDRFAVVDDIKIIIKNGIKLTFVPFVSNGRFIEALNTRKGEWEDSEVIFAHQELSGVHNNDLIVSNVENWSTSYPLVVSGHIHKKQHVNKNIIYTGSILQHSFDEKNDKSLLSISWENDIRIIKEIVLPNLPTKVQLNLTIEEFKGLKVESLNGKNVEYKIVVTGERSVLFNEKITELNKMKIKVVFCVDIDNVEDYKNKIAEQLRGRKSFKSYFIDLIKDDDELLQLYDEIR